ncbi:MAG: T9SS type A sorting domain-containing protein [Paludibacteraceae bacterium]|nr:T9SS type A sorting domain-containing protein [Paludibacteraceae bacterium]
MKHRILIVLSLVATSLLCYGGTSVLRVNGEEVGKTLQRINFDGDKAVVNFSDGTSTSYNMDLVEVVFKNQGTAMEETGIRLLSTLVHNELIVEGGAMDELVQVYDMHGRLYLQTTTLPQEALHMDVSNLSQGMYVLRIGGEAIRFIKQ